MRGANRRIEAATADEHLACASDERTRSTQRAKRGRRQVEHHAGDKLIKLLSGHSHKIPCDQRDEEVVLVYQAINDHL